jgi:hypothetical protein
MAAFATGTGFSLSLIGVAAGLAISTAASRVLTAFLFAAR